MFNCSANTRLTHRYYLLCRWESLLLMTMYGIYIIIMK